MKFFGQAKQPSAQQKRDAEGDRIEAEIKALMKAKNDAIDKELAALDAENYILQTEVESEIALTREVLNKAMACNTKNSPSFRR